MEFGCVLIMGGRSIQANSEFTVACLREWKKQAEQE